jgi:hypothetical protein
VRYAFPDVLWTLQISPKAAQKSSKSPPWITQKLSTIAQSLSKKMLQDTAGLLFRINAEQTISAKELTEDNAEAWSRDLVCLLEDMNYIVREKGMLKLNCPVFTDDDKKIVEQIADVALPLVTKTTRQNYSILKTALKNTTPLKNKIALNEVLNEAWHWIFAHTNKILAEKGFLYDPPIKRVTEARYIAWTAEFSASEFSFP